MASVLSDARLREFIGGEPLSIGALRDRYAKLAADSLDPAEVWLNWVVRRRADSLAVGTVQATVTSRGGRRTAHVAWVVGVAYQNQGFASEAARALIEWLREAGADEIVAHIHPHHRASALVARRAGLQRTDEHTNGEQIWQALGDC